MSDLPENPTAAAQQYALAYATHYTERDLPVAARAYAQVIELHPSAVQAGYAHSQISNIIKMVVPGAALLASQLEFLLQHFKKDSELPANTVGS